MKLIGKKPLISREERYEEGLREVVDVVPVVEGVLPEDPPVEQTGGVYCWYEIVSFIADVDWLWCKDACNKSEKKTEEYFCKIWWNDKNTTSGGGNRGFVIWELIVCDDRGFKRDDCCLGILLHILENNIVLASDRSIATWGAGYSPGINTPVATKSAVDMSMAE